MAVEKSVASEKAYTMTNESLTAGNIENMQYNENGCVWRGVMAMKA
jgi:hypothetical protein